MRKRQSPPSSAEAARDTTELDRRIGQLVRLRRLQIGMSQERLAELLGVTFQQVQKYEKAVNRIASSRLFDISRALDMPVADFFSDAASTGASTSLSRVLSTPEGARLIVLFSSIESRAVRKRVVELVATLAGEAAVRD